MNFTFTFWISYTGRLWIEELQQKYCQNSYRLWHHTAGDGVLQQKRCPLVPLLMLLHLLPFCKGPRPSASFLHGWDSKKANETFELSNIVKPKLISTVCRWMVLKRNELFILTKFYNDHTSVNLVEFISTSKRNIMCIDRNVPPSQFRGKKKDRISKVHINTFLYFYSVGQLLWPRPNIIPAGDHNKIIFSHSNWFIFLWSNWIIFSSFTSRLYFYKYILRCLHRR